MQKVSQVGNSTSLVISGSNLTCKFIELIVSAIAQPSSKTVKESDLFFFLFNSKVDE